jgi:hypothetical protein
MLSWCEETGSAGESIIWDSRVAAPLRPDILLELCLTVALVLSSIATTSIMFLRSQRYLVLRDDFCWINKARLIKLTIVYFSVQDVRVTDNNLKAALYHRL